MQDSSNLALYSALWVATVAAVYFLRYRRGFVGTGLVLAYLFNLWLIHWPAATIYILPWYQNYNPAVVELGFEQSTYAVIAFAVGSLVIAPPVFRLFTPSLSITRSLRTRLSPENVYLVVGLVCFCTLPMVAHVPTVTAIVSSGWSLLVLGINLKIWSAWQGERYLDFKKFLAAAFVLPFMTLFFQGFLTYGVLALSIVLTFVASFYRPRWKLVIAGLLMGYAGFSFYTAYMRDRSDIRAVIWGGESYTARVERLYDTVRNTEWLNPYDRTHLLSIDERLNQNFLVGSAIQYMEARSEEFAKGETLWEALLALIPRALWPDKPVVAGSGDLVSRYTGIQFDLSTSVGVGQVMEFYINLGSTGVIVGFLLLGTLITTLDEVSCEYLSRGNSYQFALWYFPGLAFLQVGGSLAEVSASSAASLILILTINGALQRKEKLLQAQGRNEALRPLHQREDLRTGE